MCYRHGPDSAVVSWPTKRGPFVSFRPYLHAEMSSSLILTTFSYEQARSWCPSGSFLSSSWFQDTSPRKENSLWVLESKRFQNNRRVVKRELKVFTKKLPQKTKVLAAYSSTIERKTWLRNVCLTYLQGTSGSDVFRFQRISFHLGLFGGDEWRLRPYIWIQ